jgi:hypothetical protein
VGEGFDYKPSRVRLAIKLRNARGFPRLAMHPRGSLRPNHRAKRSADCKRPREHYLHTPHCVAVRGSVDKLNDPPNRETSVLTCFTAHLGRRIPAADRRQQGWSRAATDTEQRVCHGRVGPRQSNIWQTPAESPKSWLNLLIESTSGFLETETSVGQSVHSCCSRR